MPNKPLRFLLVAAVFMMAPWVHGQGRGIELGEKFSKSFERHVTKILGKKTAETVLLDWHATEHHPEWSEAQYASFQKAAQSLARRGVEDKAAWLHLIEVANHWADINGWVSTAEGDAFFKAFERNMQRGSRRELGDYLKIEAGLTEYELDQYTLYDVNGLRWELANAITIRNVDSVTGRVVYVIETATLVGSFRGDSTKVEDVEAVYTPSDDFHLKATKGRIDWLRTGFPKGDLYTNLGPWEFSLTRPGFVSRGSVLHSSMYLPEPQVGVFEERMSRAMDAEDVRYPRFKADSSNLHIDDFFENVAFRGGFEVIGQNFFVSGTDALPARFTFRYDTLDVMVLRAPRFVIKPEGLFSKHSQVAMKFGREDSLHHHDCQIRFTPANQTLLVERDEQGLALTPFSDTYHRVSMDLTQMVWKTSAPQVHIGNINMGGADPMTIESQQYYRDHRYDKWAGLALHNPMIDLSEAGASWGNEPIPLYDLALSLGMPLSNCEQFVMFLALEHFVQYDVENRLITVLPKVHEYVLNKRKKRDYDVIQFVSTVSEGHNASISLLNYDMDVRGVDAIALSDSQKVAVHPYHRNIVVHKGLDFDFDGRIEAGRFTFHGRNHQFQYDHFQFNMPSIDSMRFKVLSFDPAERANGVLYPVRNTIENIAGELWIDDPNNKSSNLYFPQYPIFTATRSAKVYYDRAFHGVYDRKSFYVDLEPFQIDSLDNTTTEGLVFAGNFKSADIFADRDQDIRVQRDYSLGFTEQTGDAGWATYESRGNARGEVQLDMAGLRLNGDISYQAATGQSERFQMFPDSTRGRGMFDLEALYGPPRGEGHPSAHGRDAYIHWLPYASTLYAESRSAPLRSYPERGMRVWGRLTYSDDRLAARGVLAFNDAELEGRRIAMKHRWMNSAYADFRVRADSTQAWGFRMDGASADVDFAQDEGRFIAQAEKDIEFPRNQYRAEMDRATWHIPRKSISVMKGQEGTLAPMTSTHPRQEALTFDARRAEFFLVPSRLEAYKVPHIDVADARVVPDSGRVTIMEDADMRQLQRAQLMATRDAGYHKFKDVEVKIRGLNELYGRGTYRYIDEEDVEWPIAMGRIDVDTAHRIVAQGEITEDEKFRLSPWFKYYGIVNMLSVEPRLEMNGRIRITQECPSMRTDWIITRTMIDPLDIAISLPSPDTARPSRRVYNGIYLMKDSTTAYTAFGRRNNPSVAVELFRADGHMFYSHEENGYVVTTMDRWADPEAPDNMIVFQPSSCKVYGRGELSLGKQRMGHVDMHSYGSVEHSLRSGRLTARVSITLDFLFQKDVLEAIQKQASASQGIPTDLEGEALLEALYRLMDEKARNKFIVSNLDSKQPKAFRQTLVFDDVDLKWNQSTQSFRSQDALGLGSVDGQGVHRYVDGHLELRKRRAGDEISLVIGTNTEHFFTYRRNMMRYYSTDRELVQMVLSTKPRKRALKAEVGIPRYIYITTTKGNLRRFKDGLEQDDSEDEVITEEDWEAIENEEGEDPEDGDELNEENNED